MDMNDYTPAEFERQYKLIYDSIVKDGVPQKNHAVIFLGGQPGAGKSHFYSKRDDLNGYIVIDGDQYRKYHPRNDDIAKYDLENYANRTQQFVNKCVERLIEDLSDHGYNLVIEGTLRDPNVPINTCKTLIGKGYTADMYVLAVDARMSWQATINRARESMINKAAVLFDTKTVARLVPIDKYNLIVNNLPDNLQKIEDSGYFHSIHVIDRDFNILYPTKNGLSAAEVLRTKMNLAEWNKDYEKKVDEFLETKIDVLQQEVIRHRRGR